METNGKGQGSVKTARTTFRILEHLMVMDGAGVSELAREMGLAKSTIHRHLTTLEDSELVIREADTFHVGLRFLEFGEYARNRKQPYRMVRPKVEEVASRTEERAQFMVEEFGTAVYVHRAAGRNAIRTPDSGVGKRIPLHATAAGKAILAHMPPARVRAIADQRGLDGLTESSITDVDVLFDELATIRERGYSTNLGENIEGLRAVGVPIVVGGAPLGAISVSGPTHRMKGEWFETEIPDMLLGITNELEINIAYA